MATRKASSMDLNSQSPATREISRLPSLLAKLGVDKVSTCKRSSMEAIRSLIDRELNEHTMPFFIETLLGTMNKRNKYFVESPCFSLAHSVCLLLTELVTKAAHTQQVKVSPYHICCIMKNVISWFSLDGSSQSHSLHQACATLVCSLAEISAPTSFRDSEPVFKQLLHDCALLVDCLCRPLLGALRSRVEPVSMGASTCLDALVSMDTWRSFASVHLVEELCYKASNTLQERTALSVNIAQLSLLCNLARANPESLSCYRSGLLKKGADILLSNAMWQQRAAAARLIENIVSSMEASCWEDGQDKKAVIDAIVALESCRLDKVAMVRAAVGEALKVTKQQRILDNLSVISNEELFLRGTKISRLVASFCNMQESQTDHRKRRRRKPLGHMIEKHPASSISLCRSDRSPSCHTFTSSMSNWSSSESVNSSIEYQVPRRKVARVGCDYGRTISSSAKHGVIGGRRTMPMQSGAKKVNMMTQSLPSRRMISLSASKSSSSSPSSKVLKILVPASASSSSPSSLPPSSSVTPMSSDDSSFTRSSLFSKTNFGDFSAAGILQCCVDGKVPGVESNRRLGSRLSASYECVCNETGAAQGLTSPTSSSAVVPSAAEVSKGERVVRDASNCLSLGHTLPSLAPHGIRTKETKGIAQSVLQREGTLVAVPSGFLSVGTSDRGETDHSRCSEEEESGYSHSWKNVCNDHEIVETEGFSCSTPSSFHYNSIAQLDSLEGIMGLQVCRSSVKQDNSVSCCIPRTILSPSYKSCTGLSEQHLPCLSTDVNAGGNMALEGGNGTCNDSLVWRVRDNPIATDDSELDVPKPTTFDSHMLINCADRVNVDDDDEDGHETRRCNQEDDGDLDKLSRHHKDHDDWRRVHVGGESGFPTSREHQRTDGEDDAFPLRDEALGNCSVSNDDAEGSPNDACLRLANIDQEADDVNQLLISREHQQVIVSNESANLLTSSLSNRYADDGDSFSELSMLMEAHLRDHPELANESGSDRLEYGADCDGCVLLRENCKSEDITHTERKQACKLARALDQGLHTCSLVETPSDEKDLQGESGRVEGSTWFSRCYIVQTCNVLFTPCGIFILTLGLPLAIAAFNTISAMSAKEDTTNLLVPT